MLELVEGSVKSGKVGLDSTLVLLAFGRLLVRVRVCTGVEGMPHLTVAALVCLRGQVSSRLALQCSVSQQEIGAQVWFLEWVIRASQVCTTHP